jgi:hypothetical protein
MRNYKFLYTGLTIFGLLVLLLTSLEAFIKAYTHSLYFDGYPANGAFQLFNPLRRLAAGQIAGKDFQVFHGIGSALLHYPLFALLGKNLFASEMARRLMSPLIFNMTNLLILYVFTRRFSLAIFFTSLLTFMGSNILAPVYYAENSILGIRSFVPLLIISLMAIYPYLKNKLALLKQYIYMDALHLEKLILAFGFVLAFFVGTEQGLALLIGFIVAYLIFYPKKGLGKFLTDALIFVLYLMLSLLVVYGLTAGPHLFKVLRYTFIDIIQDQFWYFGVSPNRFLRSIIQLIIYPFRKASYIYFSFLLGLGLTFITCFYSEVKKHKQAFALFVLLFYGLATNIAHLGITHYRYSTPLLRISLIVIAWYLINISRQYGRHWFDKYVINKPALALANRLYKTRAWALGLLMITVFGFVLLGVKDSLQVFYKLNKKEGPLYCGTYLMTPWDLTIPITTAAIDKTILQDKYKAKLNIWSTYAGLWEAENNFFHAHSDYIIQALGRNNRQEYVDTFSKLKPKYVITFKKSFFPYEEWLWNSHWDFYEQILKNYKIKAITPITYIWQKDNNSWIATDQWQKADFIYSDDHRTCVITMPDKLNNNSNIFTVKIKYKINNFFAFMPLIGRMPRYLILPINSVIKTEISLPYYKNETIFPIFLTNNQGQIVLKPYINSIIPGSSFRITEVYLKQLDLDQKTIKLFFN